jgi:hypothetical protein
VDLEGNTGKRGCIVFSDCWCQDVKGESAIDKAKHIGMSVVADRLGFGMPLSVNLKIGSS